MADKAWKQLERRVARIFGTSRTSLSGGNGKVSRSDSHHDHLFISCKHSSRSALWTLFSEEKPKAVAEGKIPVLANHLKGAHGFLVTVHSNDLEEFCLEFLRSKFQYHHDHELEDEPLSGEITFYLDEEDEDGE